MIKRINKISEFGIFQGFRWPGVDVLPSFKAKNVIYGWNGTGKSTLATLFGLLEKKNSENKYTASPSFEIELDDNSKITQGDLENSPLVRLFDEDFVKENIDWKGRTKPIFFVGVDNVQLSRELSEKQKLREKLNNDIKDKIDKNEKKEKQFLTWKRNLANRTIKESLRTSANDKYANYDTAKLQNTINSTKDIDNQIILDEKEKTILNKKIQQSSLPPLSKLEISADIQQLIANTNSILQKTAISKTLSRLKDDKEAEYWADEGLKLHKDKNYSECKFCGCPLTSDILNELEAHFNDAYQQLSAKIKEHKATLENSIITINLKKSDFDLELRARFEELKKESDTVIESFNKIIGHLISKIDSKTPNEKVDELLLDENNDDLLNAKKVYEIIVKFSALITDHNKKVENFDKEILNAKKKIELSIIAAHIQEYRDFETQIKSFVKEIENLRSEYSQVRSRIMEIESKLSDAAKAVDQINKYLKDYFGRDEIQVEFNEQEKGFNIKRNDSIAKNLSEGERTGIAFIYFLTKLEEKNFDKSKCIVIVDDPVSSLDSNSLYFAFAFLKEMLRDVHQLFILTHTFDFLRQVKNWFNHIDGTKKEEKRICKYYMTDCYWESGQRKSKIKPLDKLLIEYQSEYHYLLKLLIDLTNDTEPDLVQVYNYPNITRKFLEIFLSFKYPHKQSLYKKMQELVKQNVIDEHTQIGISRFINELSHEFNENSAETFNMSHLFSANVVAERVVKIVKDMEPEQYKMLVGA